MNYTNYRNLIEKLSFIKGKLKRKIKEYRIVNRMYLNYLKQNPYKEQKNKLSVEIKTLRSEFIELVPDWKNEIKD